MKFVYKGKYDGKEESLPQREHPEGYVPYKEPTSMKKLAVIANGLALGITALCIWAAVARVGYDFSEFIVGEFSDIFWFWLGMIASLVAMIPHEFLHMLCFKEEVYMYQNLKQGMLFVVGIEDMSKARFIFMGLLPNIVFGLIPFIIFMINPHLLFFGALGVFSIGAGAGDYLNVFNTLVQVPKGAKVYMSGMHSYWYIPKK